MSTLWICFRELLSVDDEQVFRIRYKSSFVVCCRMGTLDGRRRKPRNDEVQQSFGLKGFKLPFCVSKRDNEANGVGKCGIAKTYTKTSDVESRNIHLGNVGDSQERRPPNVVKNRDEISHLLNGLMDFLWAKFLFLNVLTIDRLYGYHKSRETRFAFRTSSTLKLSYERQIYRRNGNSKNHRS